MGDLGDRVAPGALAGAAHDEQVAAAELAGDRGAAGGRLEQEPAGLAERDGGDGGADLGSSNQSDARELRCSAWASSCMFCLNQVSEIRT